MKKLSLGLWLLMSLHALPVVFGQNNASVGYDQTLFEGLQWRQVGPFRGGRAGTVSGVPGQPNLYYIGTAGGGVWRTQDAGTSWQCISDGYFGGSIGALAVSESDPNVIYVGEGEQTVRGNVSSGRGLWRSTDAGKTWSSIGLAGSEHIGRIRIHPTNPDLVYVAAMGNLWKPNPVRGVYRSKDGGRTWERILFESEKAGAVDLILDPNNPRILYASTWEIKRNGYRMDSGGPGSHLWKSTDGGDTWTKISTKSGWPKGPTGIIGITVSPANSERLWACIEASDGGVFRSDDGGESWVRTSDFRELRQRAWYYSRIYADTKNVDLVYVCNVSFWRSKDGGKSWESIETPHGDHHDLWIDPQNPARMAIADDGGGVISQDAGANWTTYHNQPTAQFYRVTTDNHFPFRILGAQQDNTTIRIAHRTGGAQITERDWDISAGGESAHLAPDPIDPEIVYAGTYKGYMSRFDHKTNQERSVNVWPVNLAGSGAEVMKYRFNWNYPIFFSPHDPKKLYAASNHLHMSTNGGQSWQVISPDLSRNDPETILSSGGPITQDNTGVEYYANIFAVKESQHEAGVIWAGTDDGRLHLTRDGGKNWKEVTPPMSPKWNMMNCIDVHPFNKAGVYVVASMYKFGDYTPYIFKTEDYGQTWKLINNGIPKDYYARSIQADRQRPGLLYAGTEWGMFISFDDGAHWQPFQLNLPITSIADLHIRDNSLIAATHGRSFWMLDDLTPLQELSKEIAARPFYLFKNKPSYRLAQEGNGAASKTAGTNHPNGVLFHYFSKKIDEQTPVKLEILELDGDVIRSFASNAKERRLKLDVKPGGNRFVWDMRYPGFTDFPGLVLYSSPNVGPKAPPGKYRARLSVGSEQIEQEFEIVKDPRLPNTPQDYQAQFNHLIKVRDRVSEAHQAVLDIRSIKKDLQYLKDKSTQDVTYQQLITQLVKLEEQLTAVENNIHQTKNQSVQDALNYGIKVNNRLAFLLSEGQQGDYPPTDQAKEVYEQLSADLQKELDRLDQLLINELENVNKTVKDLGIPALAVPVRKGRP